jgi:hypothetical protein
VTRTLDAALGYAAMGYPVFPCRPGAKQPAAPHGCLDATRDADRIQRWWAANPAANVAIATDGLAVIDVDPAGRDWPGDAARREAIRELAPPVQRTPRGGFHLFLSFRRENSGDAPRGCWPQASMSEPPAGMWSRPHRRWAMQRISGFGRWLPATHCRRRRSGWPTPSMRWSAAAVPRRPADHAGRPTRAGCCWRVAGTSAWRPWPASCAVLA